MSISDRRLTQKKKKIKWERNHWVTKLKSLVWAAFRYSWIQGINVMRSSFLLSGLLVLLLSVTILRCSCLSAHLPLSKPSGEESCYVLGDPGRSSCLSVSPGAHDWQGKRSASAADNKAEGVWTLGGKPQGWALKTQDHSPGSLKPSTGRTLAGVPRAGALVSPVFTPCPCWTVTVGWMDRLNES